MKKSTGTILAIAAAGAIGYYLYKSKSGARMIESSEEAGESEETGKGSEKMPAQSEVDHVIDTTASGTPITTAIRQAKQLATALQDANIIVKTPDGEPNVSVTAGSKRPGLFAKLKAKRKARKGRRKAKVSAKFLSRYKKAAALDCSKYKKAKKTKCESSKRKALLFFQKLSSQSSVI
jgi:hypothetical protein